ncbi:MAG: adenosylcobinamide-phosphate synthase CbiB [Actinomycetota bacterium]
MRAIPEVALGLLAGSVADLCIPDPSRAHPVAGFGWVATRLEARMWKPGALWARCAGVVYVSVLVGGAAMATALLDRALGRVRLGRGLLMTGVTWSVLGGASLEREARRVSEAIARGDLGDGRRHIRALVGRDPEGLDAAGLCRAAVESVAENTADAVVAALLWGAIAGPAGAVAYRAANTLDAMVGHRSPRYERFGWAAARLDDLLTWAPARLGAGLTVALSPLVGGDRRRAWRGLQRDASAHPSPNAGRLQAAFAGALDIRLGGPNRYEGVLEERPRIGEGRAPDPHSIAAAVQLSKLVGVVATALAALIAWGLRRSRPASLEDARPGPTR